VYQKIKIPEFTIFAGKFFSGILKVTGQMPHLPPISYAYADKSKFDMHKIYCQYCHRRKGGRLQVGELNYAS